MVGALRQGVAALRAIGDQDARASLGRRSRRTFRLRQDSCGWVLEVDVRKFCDSLEIPAPQRGVMDTETVLISAALGARSPPAPPITVNLTLSFPSRTTSSGTGSA